jgi:hypothetical protein
VILFNVVFVFCGLALIGLGVWLFVDAKVTNVVHLTVHATNSHLLRDSAILLISMGCLLFVVSLLGLVGAILLNTIVLGVYMALLVVTFCGEIAGAVMAIAFKDSFLDHLKQVLRDSLNTDDYYVTPPPDNATCRTTESGRLWDFVQIRMECCGIESSPQTGYEGVHYSFSANCPALPSGFNKPLTCCEHVGKPKLIEKNDNQVGRVGDFNSPNVKKVGCVESMEWWVGHYSPVLIGIGFGVAMLQTIGIIFAVCLCVNSRPASEGYKQQH